MFYDSIILVCPFLAKSDPFSSPPCLQIFSLFKLGLFIPWFGKLCSFIFPTFSLIDREISPQSISYPMISRHNFLGGGEWCLSSPSA